MAGGDGGTVYSARYGVQRSKPQWLTQSVQCPTARQHLDNMSSAEQSRMAELSWEQHHWTGPDIDVPVPEGSEPLPSNSLQCDAEQRGQLLGGVEHQGQQCTQQRTVEQPGWHQQASPDMQAMVGCSAQGDQQPAVQSAGSPCEGFSDQQCAHQSSLQPAESAAPQQEQHTQQYVQLKLREMVGLEALRAEAQQMRQREDDQAHSSICPVRDQPSVMSRWGRMEQECDRQLEQLTQAVLALTKAKPHEGGAHRTSPQPEQSVNQSTMSKWW